MGLSLEESFITFWSDAIFSSIKRLAMWHHWRNKSTKRAVMEPNQIEPNRTEPNRNETKRNETIPPSAKNNEDGGWIERRQRKGVHKKSSIFFSSGLFTTPTPLLATTNKAKGASRC